MNPRLIALGALVVFAAFCAGFTIGDRVATDRGIVAVRTVGAACMAKIEEFRRAAVR